MRKIEYDIKRDENDDMYVVLSPEYEDSTEDKFMIFYLATNLLSIAFDSAAERDNYSEEQEESLETTLAFISGITYELSELLRTEIDVSNEINKMMGEKEESNEPKWDISVKNIKERNELPDHNIMYNDNIFERVENDFKVYVKSTKKIYYLVDGITNKHWKIYKK